jgi:hypothetical protein
MRHCDQVRLLVMPAQPVPSPYWGAGIQESFLYQSQDLLDSRPSTRLRTGFRGNDDSSLPSVKNLLLKTFTLFRKGAFLSLCLALSFLLPACTSSPQETSKSLVKIANVTLSRLDERTLRVTLNYDLEAGVKLPLPYKSVLVFPLEPRGKLAGQVPEIEFSNGLIALDLEIPADAGFDWKDLGNKDACCVVSLKGAKDVFGSNVPQYERISNSVTIPLPQLAG